MWRTLEVCDDLLDRDANDYSLLSTALAFHIALDPLATSYEWSIDFDFDCRIPVDAKHYGKPLAWGIILPRQSEIQRARCYTRYHLQCLRHLVWAQLESRLRRAA